MSSIEKILNAMPHLSQWLSGPTNKRTVTITTEIDIPRERVFSYLLEPPNEEERKKLRITEYQKISEQEFVTVEHKYHLHYRIIDKEKPFHLSMETAVGLGPVRIEYLLNEISIGGSIGTKLTILYSHHMRTPAWLVRMNFRRWIKIMKRNIKR